MNQKFPAKKLTLAEVADDLKEGLKAQELQKELPAYLEKAEKEANVQILDDRLKPVADALEPAGSRPQNNRPRFPCHRARSSGRGFYLGGDFFLGCCWMSRNRKCASRRNRVSTSSASRIACRSSAPDNTAHDTRSAACSGSEMESR